MIVNQIPPQNIAVEKAVIGAMLIDGNVVAEIIDHLFIDAFYSDQHKTIYKAILQLYDTNNKIDLLTVAERLKRNNQLEEAGGVYGLSKLTNDVVSTAHLESHIKIVLEKYAKRKLIEVSGGLYHECYRDNSDPFEMMDKADAEIVAIQQATLGQEIKDVNHYAKEVATQYKEVKETGVLGIKTKIEPFDRKLCGLVSPDLVIIAARPGAGKTALALSITHEISVNDNIPGAWFSFEMDGTQLIRRLAAIDSNLNHGAIRNGHLEQYQEAQLSNSLVKIANAPIYIEDNPSYNIRSIRTRANILKRRFGIQYIVVDYLQLISGTNKTNREQDVSEISRGLKILARDLKLPVIALSQLSREVEKRNTKMPELSDLRESGAIEQDADSVLFLMRPEYYDFREPVQIGEKEYDVNGLCIGKIGKNRHGDCSSFAMEFTGSSMKFATHTQMTKI